MWLHANLVVFVAVLGSNSWVHGAAVDVALNKEILDDALAVTCGANGPEEYYTASELYKAPGERKLMVCENTSMHGPELMVDGNSDTYWQTSSSVYINRGSARATIDLAFIYEVEQVMLKLGDAKRPRRIMLEKSEDGITFRKWVIRVTDLNDCVKVFGVPVTFSPKTIDAVVCSSFANDVVPPSYETIHFDFKDIHGNLGRWRNTRFIRITMSSLYTPLGINGYRFYHIVVTDLIVKSECMCFGHQIGCTNATGRYACECGMNTQGTYCDECKPFYNQRLIQDDEPCEACNCFNHADVCVYDNNVAANNQSLNANGERIGGGRCIDCTDNTTGINCEKCITKFFRPADVPQTDEGACVPCDCHLPGSVVNPESGVLGDCFMNNDQDPPVLGMVPGDCYCKTNVHSTRCDECKPSFYNLLEDNAAGCQACECDTDGTVDGSNVCTANATGQCPCKEFVSGRQCDQCMDGYYGLNVNNTQGCSPCECDPGGAFDNTCNKETGQCRCRPNIDGRTCNAPASGYFYPGPYYIAGQFEQMEEWEHWAREDEGYYGFGYWLAGPESAAQTTLTVPLGADYTGSYHLLLHYRSPGLAQGAITVQPIAGGEVQSADITLALCNSGAAWCVYEVPDTLFSLEDGEDYRVLLRLETGEPKLDAVIAMPVEYTDVELLTFVLGEEEGAAFPGNCDVKQNDLKLGSALEARCKAAMFSLAVTYLDGARNCLCHTFGSVQEAGCEPYGGQCTCKAGVGGTTRCDQCQLEFYQLTMDGCKACNCTSNNKVCQSSSGQCVCPPNVEGRQCDRCTRNHWDWSADVGCQACNCNVTGSLNLQCHQETGVCACKQGVNSEKCDECLSGYKDFGITGCQGCDCNEDGSTGLLCDDESGQCPCKTNVEGLKCTDCKSGTFYNDASHETGCLDCICMGITENCQSTTRRLQEFDVPLTKTDSDGNVTSAFVMVTDTGTSLDATEVNIGSVTVAEDEHPALQITLGNSAAANWFESEIFSGNLLSLYHNEIQMDVYYTTEDATAEPKDVAAILIGRDDSAVRFPMQSVQPNNITTLSVTIREDRVASGTEITRGELLLRMTEATLYFPATFSTREHVSSLLGVRYHAPSASGFKDRAYGNEMCICGVGYTGMSCEECAYGYRRENASSHDYLGVCVACECNGHADFCDPDTGECEDCQHGTTGFNCQVCEDGKYGDATAGTPSDCSMCPCYSPRVVNSTCTLLTEGDNAGEAECSFCNPGYTGRLCDTCDAFYYGNPQVRDTGSCTRCDCNGNSEQCNSETGECVDCQNESTGFNCERCQDEWFGNATAQGCAPCDCDMTASNSSICDHVSGQCECYPGVGNRICDQCQENMYGYSNTDILGCTACNCNEFGSENLQCNDDGICTCKDNSGGEKCGFCSVEKKLWGLPHRECEACDCDLVGTVDIEEPCEKIFGQCECKPGVAGRQCDVCQRLYSNFGVEGCTKCSECEYSLGNDTQELKDKWETYWNHTQDIAKLQEQDQLMQNLSASISSTSADLGVSEDRLGVLEDFVKNLTDAEPANTDAVDHLMDSMQGLLDDSEAQEASAEEQLGRVNEMVGHVDGAMVEVNKMKEDIPPAIQQLTAHNQSAYELKAVADNTYDGSINVSFEDQIAQVNAEVSEQASTLDAAQNMVEMVTAQAARVVELREGVLAAQTDLLAVSGEVSGIQDYIDDVKATATEVETTLNTTLYDRDYAEARFTEASASLSEANAIKTASNGDFTAGRNLFADCITIIEGTADPLPIETEVDLTGVKGWIQASDLLEDHLGTTSTQQQDNQAPIAAAEVKAEEHTAAAQLLANEFTRVQPLGQEAVDAIEDYQAVVDTLAASVEQASNAQATMASVMEILEDVSVEDLSTQADEAETESDEAAALADDYDSIPAALRPQLTAADNALDASIATWTALEVTLDEFVASVGELETAVGSEKFAEDVAATNTAADSAIARAETLNTQDAELEPQVAALEDLVAIVQSSLNNASVLQTTIARDVEAFTDDLEDVRASVTSIEAEAEITSAKKTSIDAKLAEIEAKIAKAEALLVNVEQPVNFRQRSDALTINNRVKAGMEYNEVLLHFKYSSAAEGLLFFTENTDTREKILLQLVDGNIMYEYSNVDVDMTVTSRADLYPGVWYFILATRYAISIQLTVTRMDTGGMAVEYYRAESTNNKELTLNSPNVYIGGLPEGTSSDKVDAGTLFQGCIYNVFFDNFLLPIWQTVLHHDSESQCCSRPPALPQPDTIDATSFDGFGYMKYEPGSFSLAGDLHFRLEFRTFGPTGTMLLVDKEDVNGFLGVFVQLGKVALQFGLSGSTELLITEKRYDDGEWYQLTVMVNSTYAQLYVQSTNASNTNVDLKSREHSKELTSLADAMLTFGGQNPTTALNFGPTTLSFSGCIQNFQHNTAPSLVLVPKDLGGGALDSQGVNLDHCYAEVHEGIGISDKKGTASLTTLPSFMQTFSFQFSTYAPSGLLIYAPLSSSGSVRTFFSLSLYNGNVMLLMNQGSGVQEPLVTHNKYLSNGKLHVVSLDLTFTNKPRLNVDGESHIPLGAYTMSPNPQLRDQMLYVGGVPDSVVLDAEYDPVRYALIGGFKNVRINGAEVDYWIPDSLPRTDAQKHVFLSGLPVAMETPPPPYVTTPAPPTPPAPSCAEPYAFSGNTLGSRFGDQATSFLAFPSADLGTDYENAFSITVVFRALQPNGLLFYMSHSTRTDYFALYMTGGAIEGRMKRNNAVTQISIRSQDGAVFDDGLWWTLIALRVNDFLAIIVQRQNQKYYKNNNGNTAATSTLEVDGSMYVGGVPDANQVPFDEFGIQRSSFQGCIRSFTFTKHSYQEIYFNIGLPADFDRNGKVVSDASAEQGVDSCYVNVESGLYMSGEESYVKLNDRYTIDSSFVFHIEFTGTERNGTLMLAYRSSTEFLLLDFINGVVRLSLGTIGGGDPLSVLSTQEVNDFAVCSGIKQTATIKMGTSSVELTVNGYQDDRAAEVFTFPQGFVKPSMSDMDMYIGGSTNTNWEVPVETSKDYFYGCVKTVEVNSQTLMLTSSDVKNNVKAGCPLPPVVS